MKKLFMSAVFMFAMILTTTASAASWISFHSDTLQEEFIDTKSVRILKDEGGVKIFSAIFKTVFTDKGRRSLGLDNVKEMISLRAFAKKDGDRFYSTRYRKFYGADGSLVKSMDTADEWRSVEASGLNNEMYNIAELYLWNAQ